VLIRGLNLSFRASPGFNLFGVILRSFIFIFILIAFFSASATAQDKSAAAPESPTAAAEFTSDGCTWFPDGNYFDCCKAHDAEYFAGGSWSARWRSDKKLFQCVAAKPKFYNKLIAPVIWLGVRAGGVPWLNAKFSWGFGKRKKPSKIKKDSN
jgi:hypothetical protein